MRSKVNYDDPSMKLVTNGAAGFLHRSVAFALEDVILEVRKLHKVAKKGNAQVQRTGSYISQVRESPNHPWVDFVLEKTDPYKAAKIKLVEEKLMELLSFVLDWKKDKADD
jgi:hypothetical protein